MLRTSHGSSGGHALLLLLLLLGCMLPSPAAAVGAAAAQAAAAEPSAAAAPSNVEAAAVQQQLQQQQLETDGVEHSASVAVHGPAAAAAARAAAAAANSPPAAPPADAISSAAESAASAIITAAAGPAASLAQQQQQQQDSAAAADSADKESAAAAVAATAAAAALSPELLPPAPPPLGSDVPSETAAAEQQQQQQQEVDSEGSSPFSSLPDTVSVKLKGALRFAAVAAAVLMQLTPLPTVARIVSCRSTLGLQSLPFFTLLFSASLWLLYGILRVDPTLLLPNVSGVVAGGWFVVTFWANAGREDKQRFLLSLYLKAGALIVACLLLMCLCCPYAFAELVVGLVASVVNVVSYAAPLAALRVVLKEKSTALMPAEMSVGNFICSGLWLAYGWTAEDIFIVIPNLIGFGVGSAQLLLLALIPPPARQGFSAVGSTSSSSGAKQVSGKGLLGAAAAWIRQSEGDGWEEQTGDTYSSCNSKCGSGYPSFAAAPAPAPAAAAAAAGPRLQASVCANAPSLPTHDELLKHCGFNANPDELTIDFDDDFLE
ncbi:hypothetical protein Esti_006850 [Eimeria stiedai]